MVHCLPSMFTYEGKKIHCGTRRALLAKSVLILASAQGTFGFTKSGPLGVLLAKYVLTLVKRASPSQNQKGDTMATTYTSYDQLPLALNADDVAAVLGISRANAYTLMHSKDFPTITIGKRMIVPKDKLLAWMDERMSA